MLSPRLSLRLLVPFLVAKRKDDYPAPKGLDRDRNACALQCFSESAVLHSAILFSTRCDCFCVDSKLGPDGLSSDFVGDGLVFKASGTERHQRRKECLGHSCLPPTRSSLFEDLGPVCTGNGIPSSESQRSNVGVILFAGDLNLKAFFGQSTLKLDHHLVHFVKERGNARSEN